MADLQDTGGGRHRRPETDDGQPMNGVEYPTPKFHSITVTGDDGGNMLTVVELADEHPQLLGEPPVQDEDGNCSHCSRWAHYIGGVDLTPRGFHRFDLSPAGWYYPEELEAFQR